MNKCSLLLKLTLASLFTLCSALIIKSLLVTAGSNSILPSLSNAAIHYSLLSGLAVALLPGLFLNIKPAIQRLLSMTMLIVIAAAAAYSLIISAQLTDQTLLPLYLLLLPLLIAMPRIQRKSVYTCQWSLFLSMFYFMHGMTDAYSLKGSLQYAAIAETTASLAFFTGLIMYVRCQKEIATG